MLWLLQSSGAKKRQEAAAKKEEEQAKRKAQAAAKASAATAASGGGAGRGPKTAATQKRVAPQGVLLDSGKTRSGNSEWALETSWDRAFQDVRQPCVWTGVIAR